MITTKDEKADFENIGEGIVSKQFGLELAGAIENCVDLDTRLDVWREVVIKFKIRPNEKRDAAVFEIQVSTKGAPPKPYQTTMAIGMEYGDGVAYEFVRPKQEAMSFETTTNVSLIRKGENQ